MMIIAQAIRLTQLFAEMFSAVGSGAVSTSHLFLDFVSGFFPSHHAAFEIPDILITE